jgi:hypothetical protein
MIKKSSGGVLALVLLLASLAWAETISENDIKNIVAKVEVEKLQKETGDRLFPPKLFENSVRYEPKLIWTQFQITNSFSKEVDGETNYFVEFNYKFDFSFTNYDTFTYGGIAKEGDRVTRQFGKDDSQWKFVKRGSKWYGQNRW